MQCSSGPMLRTARSSRSRPQRRHQCPASSRCSLSPTSASRPITDSLPSTTTSSGRRSPMVLSGSSANQSPSCSPKHPKQAPMRRRWSGLTLSRSPRSSTWKLHSTQVPFRSSPPTATTKPCAPSARNDPTRPPQSASSEGATSISASPSFRSNPIVPLPKSTSRAASSCGHQRRCRTSCTGSWPGHSASKNPTCT